VGRLDGKVALVSGGARGIGAAIGSRLAAEGARAVLGDILRESEFEAAEELGAAGLCLRLDVSNGQDWTDAVRAAVDHFGGLDTLVNNAGLVNFGPIGDYWLAQWDRVLAVNLIPKYYRRCSCAQEAPGAFHHQHFLDCGHPRLRTASGLHRIEIRCPLVVYLAGDESSFVTGAEFVIDGGETAGMAHNPVLKR
jgi:NAD(P)-dependent dehydrogenase (short-subunit alcohol dehydrogenase family)